jgi:hypothetical protein
MIRKSVKRFSLATNAKRLRGDYAQSGIQGAMALQPDPIALQGLMKSGLDWFGV